MPELPPPPGDRSAPDRQPPPALAAALVRWESWRARVSPIATVAGGAVALLVVAGITWSTFGRGRAPEPELSLPRASPAPTSAGQKDAERGDAEPVVVHVAGAVARPGLYRLAPAARVADAVEAAGGATADADLDTLNLAAKLSDEDRVYVARRGETPPAAAAPAAGSAKAEGGPLDLNTATAVELEGLPGIGPSTAEAIVAYRTERGRFRSVDELLDVRGIGESKLAALRSKVTVR